MRLAKVKVDADFTAPCNPSILYPEDGGNMHCFTAVTACMLLDVLGPPYSDYEGRHCTYYNNYPFSDISGELPRNSCVWIPVESDVFILLFHFMMRVSFNFYLEVNANYTFYEISVEGISIPEEERNGYEWLQEKEQLEDLEVDGKMYSGPKIHES